MENNPEIVLGNILNSNCHIIIQQLNCLCVTPHGLSQIIAQQYPYANVYSQRRRLDRRNLAIEQDRGIPGQITISGLGEKRNIPIVVGLYGQYDFGNSYYKNNRPNSNPPETKAMREIWFEEALDNLVKWLVVHNINHETIKIAFPFNIGCGLAGGNWENYLTMIHNFTHKVKCQVKIIKLVV